ncbi:MAG: leucine--tRNA ligase, partial [Oligoflexales bacterium]|nr:leucine--tRNA ligase [Oligoflexales bacterium]
AFGLPAENFAIKMGIHPDVSTTSNVQIMREQFGKMGVAYNWKYTLDTSKPDYYKWTQWIFAQLYKHGLAYKKMAPVNWCGSCQTVLANEQVKDGECERCGSSVVRKNLKQWFFRISNYAEELLSGLDGIDWPHKTVAMQKNWIGKSIGTEISFKVKGTDKSFQVFTTRPDTLFGVTFVTIPPEHHLVDEITTPEQKEAVGKYVLDASKISEMDRVSTVREKTGVFSGSYAVNPINGETVPIWIGDYVLVTYGTGAVMGVPGHDERDFDFARKFGLTIRKVILKPGEDPGSRLTEAYAEPGIMMNSGSYDGMDSEEGKYKVTQELERLGSGKGTTVFRLRDWLVSRQRYWGAPIPIIYCDDCGEVLVKDGDLPVLLPSDVEFRPTGESPLARCESFLSVNCPKCKKPAKREADTLDTFVCSSWYYLRFPSANCTDVPFDRELTRKMLPVDKYVGGPEHACMHLLYARFITKALRDMGYIDFDEPFLSLTHQGLILGPDGFKMSKSRGNSVSPDEYVEKYGADILRLYLCFGFNYVDGGPWDGGGIIAVDRFIERVKRLFKENEALFHDSSGISSSFGKDEKTLLNVFHNTIKSITNDTERFMFNTSVARMMELYNGVTDYIRIVSPEQHDRGLIKEILSTFLRLLAPYAPHISEELWHCYCGNESIFKESWPAWDERWLVLDRINIGVMVNGKFRAEIEVGVDDNEEAVAQAAVLHPKVVRQLEGKKLIKKIFVKGKMINLIVSTG